jgi:hypothetical protein
LRTPVQPAGANAGTREGRDAADETSSDISLVKPASSQGKNTRDPVKPAGASAGTRKVDSDVAGRPQTPSAHAQNGDNVTTDIASPNAKCARPPRPEDAVYDPAGTLQSTLLEGGKAGASDELSGDPGRNCNTEERAEEVEIKGEKGEWASGRASEKEATAKGPGEEAMDRMADGVTLAAPASSLNNNGGDDSVCRTDVNPEPTPPTASSAATDPATPNAKRAEPQEPAGAPRKPQDALAEGQVPQSTSLEGKRWRSGRTKPRDRG